MDLGAPGSSGLFGSLRGLADGVFGSVKDRLELLSVELQEEKQRLIQTALWAVALVFTAGFALVFVNVALVAAVWSTRARVPAIAGLAGFYLLCALGAAWKLRASLSRKSRPFAATIAELEVDQESFPR